ncbi:MAG: zf-HC2 domain-containing protein [Armatimonadetes bacterium]|nr:zf-HC2 domain-containing protein [Armatimonadota bacterium]
MHCGKVRKLLADYADETLSMRAEEQVRRHMEGCRRCAGLAEGLARTAALVRVLPRLETSPEFVRNLRRHLPVAVALSRRTPEPAGVRGWLSRHTPRGRQHYGLVLAPLALAVALLVYAWSIRTAPLVTASEPVISETAYLAAVAREHALYASEHPLMDTSAANLSVTLVSARKDR